MKQIFLSIAFSMILFGCQESITKIGGEAETYGIDFREYSKKGFLFTPYSYNGKYDPVGLIIFSIKSGAELQKIDPEKITNYQRAHGINYEWVYKIPTGKDILDYAYKRATELGADAVCDFKIDRNYENITVGISTLSLPVLSISGFAIIRLN